MRNSDKLVENFFKGTFLNFQIEKKTKISVFSLISTNILLCFIISFACLFFFQFRSSTLPSSYSDSTQQYSFENTVATSQYGGLQTNNNNNNINMNSFEPYWRNGSIYRRQFEGNGKPYVFRFFYFSYFLA